MNKQRENSNSIRQVMQSQHNIKHLLELAKTYAYDYLSNEHDRNPYPTEEAIKQLSVFDENMPEVSQDAEDILRLLHENGSPASVAHTGGRYFGFVNGGVIPVSLAARWISDAWDQNCALWVLSPISSKLEMVCEKWLVDLFGFPSGSVMALVGGTSIATLTGLAAGRHKILSNLDWDVNAKGLFGAPAIRIVLGEEAHGTVFKALSILGLGRDNIEFVPADDQGRIDVDKMPVLDDRTIVIAHAGNVNSGAFDPFEEICSLAQDAGAWVHVDGAFGLWALGSENKKQLALGVEKADSWSVDAHKTLNAPYDCGIIICKDPEALRAAMQISGSYIQFDDQRDGLLYTPDMSRRGRAVDLWASLKFLGRKGIEEMVDHLCDRADQFGRQLASNGFRILNDIVFNQVLVACDTPEETKATLEIIQTSGEIWCGGAEWKNEPVIRISVCSWATTREDIELSVKAFIDARELAKN